MGPTEFVSALGGLSFQYTFNPYSCRCPIHDKVDAPRRRARTLSSLLGAAIQLEIDSIWIGRDLGYRGGRRTGLALTDDIHMQAHARRWGITANRPTIGQPVAERTAAVIWRVLDEITVPIFLWNVFPLHPHEPGDPFSNRAHNSLERTIGEEILAELCTLLRPRRLIAIGNDAARSLHRVMGGQNIVHVRHPSYGGEREFVNQMKSLYICRPTMLL
jgi:hypothetical protein